jgi:hypothetical protein
MIRIIQSIQSRYESAEGLPLLLMSVLNQGQVYPGTIPSALSQELRNKELRPEEKLARGLMVKGFTPRDLRAIDRFNGLVSICHCSPCA